MKWILSLLPIIIEVVRMRKQEVQREIFSFFACMILFCIAALAAIIGLGFILWPFFHLIATEVGNYTASFITGVVILVGAGFLVGAVKKRI